ncbi:hypothetical protein PFISCL1PPCAC_22007, partial [Pristionchus fissidentatus]
EKWCRLCDARQLSCFILPSCSESESATSKGEKWCRLCNFGPFDCFILPSNAESETSPYRLGKWPVSACAEHGKPHSLHCSCGKVICSMCTESSHASHFRYAELAEMENRLAQEMDKMGHLKKDLMLEKSKMAQQRKGIERHVNVAKDEIAAKFARIIAQAISRCLDLMAQVEIVGMKGYRELNVHTV